MSVVTLAQETLAVVTELTDEEINGVVGGGYGPDVSIGVENGAKVNGKKNNTQISTQVGVAIAKKGNATVIQKSQQEIDNSADTAIIGGYYPW